MGLMHQGHIRQVDCSLKWEKSQTESYIMKQNQVYIFLICTNIKVLISLDIFIRTWHAKIHHEILVVVLSSFEHMQVLRHVVAMRNYINDLLMTLCSYDDQNHFVSMQYISNIISLLVPYIT